MRSSHLPPRYRGVKFEHFAAGFQGRCNKRRWRALVETLKDATPTERWAFSVEGALPTIIVNFAWAAAVTSRQRRAPHAIDHDVRQTARRVMAAMDRAEAAYANLSEMHPSDLPKSLGAEFMGRRAAIGAIVSSAPLVGGRPDKRQFEYLMALCASLFRNLTGHRPTASLRDPFAPFANQVVGLVASAQRVAGLGILAMPESKGAFRKRLARMAGGQISSRS